MFSVLCVCQSVGKGEGPHLTTTYDDIGQSQVTCDPQPPPPSHIFNLVHLGIHPGPYPYGDNRPGLTPLPNTFKLVHCPTPSPPHPTQTSVAKHAVGIRLMCLLVSISSSKCVVRYNKVIIFETVYNDSLG